MAGFPAPHSFPSDCLNLMLSISPTYLLYFLPLLLAISVVYGATRHEDLGAIIGHSLQSGYWVAGFMGIIFLVLLIVGWMI